MRKLQCQVADFDEMMKNIKKVKELKWFWI
jgi:hypothetical protein